MTKTKITIRPNWNWNGWIAFIIIVICWITIRPNWNWNEVIIISSFKYRLITIRPNWNWNFDVVMIFKYRVKSQSDQTGIETFNYQLSSQKFWITIRPNWNWNLCNGENKFTVIWITIRPNWNWNAHPNRNHFRQLNHNQTKLELKLFLKLKRRINT